MAGTILSGFWDVLGHAPLADSDLENARAPPKISNAAQTTTTQQMGLNTKLVIKELRLLYGASCRILSTIPVPTCCGLPLNVVVQTKALIERCICCLRHTPVLAAILLMDKILHDLKDSKLWELWYIPYNG